jgi:hypothetical protein
MCDGTVLPHCGHLLKCGARQRLAAFRIRNRILDVLRFGTPMAGVHRSTLLGKNNRQLGSTSQIDNRETELKDPG